jgi:DNA repair exonuclease SbcCD ATPase subunit
LVDEVATVDKSIQEMTAVANVYSVEKEKLNSLIRATPQDGGLTADLSTAKTQLANAIASFNNLCTLGDGCLNHKTALSSRTSFIEERIKEIENKLADFAKKSAEHAEAVRLATAALPAEPSREALDAAIARKNTLNTHIRAIASFESAEKELSQVIASVGEKRVMLAEKEATAVSLHAQLAGLGEKVKAFNLDAITTRVRELDLSLRAANEKASTASSVIASQEILLGKIAASVKRQHEIEMETIRLRRDKEALELVKDAFGSKGIKAVAVDVLIPQLETAVNDVLSQLSDFRVTLETQKSSVDGESQIEGLFINVHNPQGQSMEYGAFSGGEKVKVTVAIAEALAGLQKVGFRLLDEAIVGLDEESVLSFTQAMTKIQTKFPQMLVISHIPQIKELFEDRIEIVKRDGVSMIA